MATSQKLTAESIQKWMVNQLIEQLDLDEEDVDITITMDNFGLDSAKAMSLMSQAEQYLGFEVSPTLLWHYPTIETLAARLAEEAEETEDQLLQQVDEAKLAEMLAEVEQV